MELFGSRLVLERGDIELQQAVEDILLRARTGNIPELNLADIAGELDKMHSYDGYIDPHDGEFIQTLIGVLQQSDWVKHADPSGRVVLKSPEEMIPNDEEPGDEVEQAQDKQHDKAEKTAMQNIKKGGTDNEL